MPQTVAPLRMEMGKRTQTTRTGGNEYCYYRTTLVTIIVYIYLYHDLRDNHNNKSNLLRLIFVSATSI
jgi:hypothetical protein